MTHSNELAEVLQRSRPFRSSSQKAVVGLLRTTDLLRRRLGDVVAAGEITLQQYNVLRILRGAGPEGLPTLTVAERMIERTPGVTRLLDRLEEAGWVERSRCTEDRRRVLATITPAGRELLARLDEPLARAEENAFEALAREELDVFVARLEALRRGLEQEWDRQETGDRPKPGRTKRRSHS